MRYVALAVDFDGTIAKDGEVPEHVTDALHRVRESGRRTILVTGRELPELRQTFAGIGVFDRVVAENGAVVFDPERRETRTLGEPPPSGFVETLKRRGVDPISVGSVIVATWEPHETAVLETIRDLGLGLQIVFNKGAVMALPSGVDKATGLAAALDDLGLSVHNVVGVGDAENDHAFLERCELSVAVGNALDALKERCDHVTRGERGDGVIELIEGILEDDLRSLDERVGRHDIPIGSVGEDRVTLRPYRSNVLVAGPSGSGKSTMVAAFVEGVLAQRYQFCLIDPEGDYEDLERATVLGSPDHAPTVPEAIELLSDPARSLVLNLLGVRLDDRPGFLASFLPRLQELRMESGRPHWIIVDEAHHLLPASLQRAGEMLPKRVGSLVMVTVHPDWVNREALESVGTLLTPAKGAQDTVTTFASAIGADLPDTTGAPAKEGQAVAWFRFLDEQPFAFDPLEPSGERRRHLRKYAEGDLEEDAFYFRGPDDKLNLRVQNLALFAQIADGIDDETWAFHLERGDYERWFRLAIGDDELGDLAASAAVGDTADARRTIIDAIEERYTAPA